MLLLSVRAILPSPRASVLLLFFFAVPRPPEIYTLSLHDALPILGGRYGDDFPLYRAISQESPEAMAARVAGYRAEDRKSTRLNSSHLGISYAVFCVKKKQIESSHY